MNKTPASGAERRPEGKVEEVEETNTGDSLPEEKGAKRPGDNKLQAAVANVKAALKNSRHS